jgi:hypothetical protein
LVNDELRAPLDFKLQPVGRHALDALNLHHKSPWGNTQF